MFGGMLSGFGPQMGQQQNDNEDPNTETSDYMKTMGKIFGGLGQGLKSAGAGLTGQPQPQMPQAQLPQPMNAPEQQDLSFKQRLGAFFNALAPFSRGG